MTGLKRNFLTFILCISLFLTANQSLIAQNQEIGFDNNHFYANLRFGGGLGLNIGGGYTNITLSPSTIYQFDRFALGAGLQMSYVNVKNHRQSFVYGVNLLALATPIPQIQISAEIEQLRINTTFKKDNYKDNYWNTALFIGAGYHTNNATVGVRYNVLHKSNSNNLHSTGFVPFVRVYF